MAEELVERIVRLAETGEMSELSAACAGDPSLVNSVSESGRSPLVASAWGGKIENVIYLVEHGAKLDYVSTKGATALHYAAGRGHEQVVKYLLQQGANANQCVNGFPGLTSLCLASQKGFTGVVDVLLDAGADIDRESRDGSFPLFSAVCGGSLPVVKLLVKRGADLNKRNNGLTARDVAMRMGRGDIVGYIDFSPRVPRRVDGRDFVEFVCEQKPRSAGDLLMACAADECDWLELKASFYVSASDPDLGNRDVISAAANEGVSPEEFLNRLNLGRIAKAIIALHNTRGGVVLVGISPDATHRPISLVDNDPDGILGKRGLNDYVDRARARLNRIPFAINVKKRGAIVAGKMLRELYDARMVKYKGHDVVALIVSPAAGDNICVTKVLEDPPSFVAYRRTACGATESKPITTMAESAEFVAAMHQARAKTDLLEWMGSHGIYAGGGRYFDSWPGARERFFTGFLRMDGKTSNKEMLKDIVLYLLIVAAGYSLRHLLGVEILLVIAQWLGLLLLMAPLVRRTRDLGCGLWVAFVPIVVWIVAIVGRPIPARVLMAVFGLMLFVMAVRPGRVE